MALATRYKITKLKMLQLLYDSLKEKKNLMFLSNHIFFKKNYFSHYFLGCHNKFKVNKYYLLNAQIYLKLHNYTKLKLVLVGHSSCWISSKPLLYLDS